MNSGELFPFFPFFQGIFKKVFRGLSKEEKHAEVMRLLPSVTNFSKNFDEMKLHMEIALDKLKHLDKTR